MLGAWQHQTTTFTLRITLAPEGYFSYYMLDEEEMERQDITGRYSVSGDKIVMNSDTGRSMTMEFRMPDDGTLVVTEPDGSTYRMTRQ